MKVNFDTADYFNFKTVVWGLLGVAALIIVYHAGVTHGECRAQKHMMYMHKMHGQMGGSIRMRASGPAQPMHGMRTIDIQQAQNGENFFIYKSQ
jgi:hypothetical protein